MQLHKGIQVNVAASLATGGAFFLVQIALAVVYRQTLTWTQYLGIVIITGGIMLVTLTQVAEGASSAVGVR